MSVSPQFSLIDPDGIFPDFALEVGAGDVPLALERMTAIPRCGQKDGCILLADHVEAEALIRRLREEGHDGPVVVLRNLRDTRRAASLLDAGADDDIFLPVTWGEVKARIEAIQRRAKDVFRTPQEISGIRIFPDGRLPEVDGRKIPLSPHEVQILEQLLRNVGRFVSRSSLYDCLYGLSNRAPADNVIEAHICNIRRKIGMVVPGLHKRIETSRGRGYRFI